MAEERLIIEGADLEAALPHRGRNLIIDRDECYYEGEDPFGSSTVMLAPGDPAGRDIFLRGSSSGSGQAIMEFAFAEHAALSAICVLRRLCNGLGEDDVCYFASITNFTSEREAPAGEALRCFVSRKADKGPFRRFSGKMSLEGGEAVAKMDITSFTLRGSEEEPREMLKAGELVKAEMSEPVDHAKFAWKDPSMVFVDEMISIDPGGRTAGFSYTYPGDHPFTAGHFPGNPVMMGVTQWMTVSDSAAWLAGELVRRGEIDPGERKLRCSGELLRDDGTVVAEVKGTVKRMTLGPGGELGAPQLLANKRVVFRDMVRPGEPLRIRARIEKVDEADG